MEARNLTYKNFNFCWCINDFQYNTEQFIQSTTISIPPFSGVFWCLRVKLLDPGNVGSFDCYLHRIPSEPGPDIVFVDFIIQVSGSSVQNQAKEFKDVEFLNDDPCPSNNPCSKMNVEVLKFPNPPYELVINCEIHRYEVAESYTTRYHYVNLISLCNDMLLLKINSYFTDLTLIVQHQEFLTHKAIIDTRLPLLSKVFNINYVLESEVEVFGIAPSLMKSLLHYAYTGSLRLESYNHLQLFHSLAGVLELVDLQRLMHTSANKCVVRTVMNIQKKTFTWVMNQGLTWTAGDDMVATILAHDIGFAQTLTVSWGPIEFESSLFLNFKFQLPVMLIDHPIFMRCTFRIKVGNSILHAGTFQNLFRSNAVWSTGPLIAKYLLDTYDSPVTFQFEIELCNGEGKTCIEESDADIAFPFPVTRNTEKLSYDLKNLFTTKKFSDVTLITQYKMEFHAHRVILASRSRTFQKLIKNFMSPTNFLQVNGVSNEALLFVLYYIYTGRTKGLNQSNVQDFGMAARYFQLRELVSETNFVLESLKSPSESLAGECV